MLANPANRTLIQSLSSGSGVGSNVLNDSAFLSQLDPRLAHPFLVGFADSMSLVLTVATVILAITFVLMWFMPERVLKTGRTRGEAVEIQGG